jgi:hypothetical protein
MSKIVIVILIYHRHKHINLIYKHTKYKDHEYMPQGWHFLVAVKTPKHNLQRCDDHWWYKIRQHWFRSCCVEQIYQHDSTVGHLMRNGHLDKNKGPCQKATPSAQPNHNTDSAAIGNYAGLQSTIWGSFFKHLTSVCNTERLFRLPPFLVSEW